MASFNRVVLLGNITRDVELRYIASGKAVTDVGLAINDRRKSESGEWIEDTTFVDVTLWGRTAEVASEYASKGSPVLIEGHLKLDSWEKDGKKHSKLKVVGDKLQLLGSGKGKPAAEEPAWDGRERKPAARTAQQKAVAAGQGGADDDIPF